MSRHDNPPVHPLPDTGPRTSGTPCRHGTRPAAAGWLSPPGPRDPASSPPSTRAHSTPCCPAPSRGLVLKYGINVTCTFFWLWNLVAMLTILCFGVETWNKCYQFLILVLKFGNNVTSTQFWCWNITVETRNLEVPRTCKHNSRHPEIDPSESFLRY